MALRHGPHSLTTTQHDDERVLAPPVYVGAFSIRAPCRTFLMQSSLVLRPLGSRLLPVSLIRTGCQRDQLEWCVCPLVRRVTRWARGSSRQEPFRILKGTTCTPPFHNSGTPICYN